MESSVSSSKAVVHKLKWHLSSNRLPNSHSDQATRPCNGPRSQLYLYTNTNHIITPLNNIDDNI